MNINQMRLSLLSYSRLIFGIGWGVICSITGLSNIALAKAYIPSSPDYIVAQWNNSDTDGLRDLKISSQSGDLTNKDLVANDVAARVALANQYLQLAAQPGQSRLYGVAQATLKPLVDAGNTDVALLLAWAQVQQHQHHFDLALRVLDKLFAQQPENISAQLLAARIHLIQANPEQAQRFCLALLGQADLLTLSACSLEVRSSLGEQELKDSYGQLQQLLLSQGLPKDERNAWILQMLADMALRLEQPEQALQFLDAIEHKQSLSWWVQWSDIQLALGEYQEIVKALSVIARNSQQADDALLVRLALAEKNLAQSSHWQRQLAERIALRELRDDQAHAADLAIYYLDLAPDPRKALHWAQRNWQQAREPSDKNLLQRAERFAALAQQEQP